jgi:hypothetical protein
MAKTIYVEVKIQINDDSDPFETISECDYEFSGDNILSHEIISVTDSNNCSVY